MRITWSGTRFGALALAAWLLAAPAASAAPLAPGEAARELAPGGRLRAAINLGNPVLARREGGALAGISVDLARALGERLGLPVDLVAYDGAGQVSDAAHEGAWDVAFLAVDPVRARDIAFTAPYLVIEGTYLVAEDSPIRAVEDADRAGARLAVGRGSAYDLYLTRALRRAELVRAPTSAEAIALFARGGLDAAAGVRQPLAAFAAGHPGTRVVPGRFMAIEQAMGMPQGRPVGLAALRAFVEVAKASGFVASAIERHGQPDALVAPPAAP